VPRETDELFLHTGLTAPERSLRAKQAANARWAREIDRIAATEPARKAALEKFADLVDPDRVLPPAQRRKLARNAQVAHMQRMTLRRQKAERLAREQRRNGGAA
jgi:hypothetical protein